MKVFVAWSGTLSGEVARIVCDYLPQFIQELEPFISKDIDKGAIGIVDLTKHLNDAAFGIVCLTKNSLDSTWLHFESGALFGKYDKARVSPLLIDLTESEIKKPLSEFQYTKFTRDDYWSLIQRLNKLVTKKIEEATLKKVFDRTWPHFEEEITKKRTELGDEVDGAEIPPNTEEIILGEVRELAHRMSRYSSLIGYMIKQVETLNESNSKNESRIRWMNSTLENLESKLSSLVPESSFDDGGSYDLSELGPPLDVDETSSIAQRPIEPDLGPPLDMDENPLSPGD